jgi:hypothetical protein
MSITSHRRNLTALTVGAMLALPAGAFGDPPKDNLPSPQAHIGALVKSYEMNSANGDYAPVSKGSAGRTAPIHTEIGPAVAPTTAPAKADTGFSWSDAAAGAGIALLFSAALAAVARTVARRRQPLARARS